MSSVRIAGRRSGLWLIAAGIIGLLAAVVTLRSAGAAPAQGRIVVASQALPPGLLLDAEAVGRALVAAPAPAALDLRGVFADAGEVVGRRVVVPIGAGEPLTEATLGGGAGAGPSPLAAGERAVAVPLSAAGGAAAGLTAGARVDVVASTGEGLAGRTAVVVGDAEVLAIAETRSPDGFGESGEAWLRVSSAQALRITAALNFAREVRLLARPRDEGGESVGPRGVSAP